MRKKIRNIATILLIAVAVVGNTAVVFNKSETRENFSNNTLISTASAWWWDYEEPWGGGVPLYDKYTANCPEPFDDEEYVSCLSGMDNCTKVKRPK